MDSDYEDIDSPLPELPSEKKKQKSVFYVFI